jgi:hypothetical protein
MKKIIRSATLLLLIIPTFFISCEKEKPLSEFMIGKWDVVHVTINYYQNNVLKEEDKIYLDAGTITLQFVDGGTGIYSESSNDYLFSWTLSGTSLRVENLSTQPETWDLRMDGDKLIWTWPRQASSQDPTVAYANSFTGSRIQ